MSHEKEKDPETRLLSIDCIMWLEAFMPFAFYAMARCDEVLSLKYSNVTEKQRESLAGSTTETTNYTVYRLIDRKTSDPSKDASVHNILGGQAYNLHDVAPLQANTRFISWLDYCRDDKGHVFQDNHAIFPSLTKIQALSGWNRSRVSELNLSSSSIDWCKPMSVARVINLLNCICTLMTNDPTFPLDDFCKSTLENIHLTTHSFRRGGAQHKFFYAEDKWSLSFLKYWCGWSPGHSNDVVMKYLLDSALFLEDEVRADAQAPDRCQLNPGCPLLWQFRPPEADVASSISQQKRLSCEQRLTSLEEKVDKLIEMNDQILQMLTPSTPSEAFRNYITSTKPADSRTDVSSSQAIGPSQAVGNSRTAVSSSQAIGQSRTAASSSQAVGYSRNYRTSASSAQAIGQSRTAASSSDFPKRHWSMLVSMYNFAHPEIHVFVPIKEFPKDKYPTKVAIISKLKTIDSKIQQFMDEGVEFTKATYDTAIQAFCDHHKISIRCPLDTAYALCKKKRTSDVNPHAYI